MSKKKEDKIRKWTIILCKLAFFGESIMMIYKHFFLGIPFIKLFWSNGILALAALLILWGISKDTSKFLRKMYKYGDMCPKCGSKIAGINCTKCEFVVPKGDMEKTAFLK